MLCSILVRRLKEGATYEDFHRAWFPEHGFGVPARVRNARRVDDPRELVSIESTVIAGIYEVLDDYDFTSTPHPTENPGL